jgi:hypothetical protein
LVASTAADRAFTKGESDSAGSVLALLELRRQDQDKRTALQNRLVERAKKSIIRFKPMGLGGCSVTSFQSLAMSCDFACGSAVSLLEFERE